MADRIVRSYSIDKELDDKFSQRMTLHKYGDKSKVIRELIRMFLDKKLTLTIPGTPSRTF